MARAARESRQQARTIAYALARPLRGLAGRFELGAFRSIFLQVLLGPSPWLARKVSAQSSKDDSKITPRTLANQPPEARKSTSGGSKMRPKWLQIGSPEAPRSRGRLWGPFWSAPGRPGAAPGAFLGRSWRLLGSSWASQGVPAGSQRVPGRVPESLRDVILGAFLLQGLPARKK